MQYSVTGVKRKQFAAFDGDLDDEQLRVRRGLGPDYKVSALKSETFLCFAGNQYD